ncbi:tRNA lysidine(34) synthetase [Sanguibacter massiliensis]|uniref:tRNA lysidine(34) synthetase n=1 Tax=Sanguibacter massiliensis TaxID=1973217 RepID=UPI000C849E96|nr:tRNA lysidine(34) synthetase [Sanguibacter massiliensis]
MSLPTPHTVAGRRAVREALADLPGAAPVVVGCSGGPDSLALVACVAAELGLRPMSGRAAASVPDGPVPDAAVPDGPVADVLPPRPRGDRTAGRTVRVVVVDHGLQPGSDAVAERAAAMCRALGLTTDVVRVVVDAPGGPEAAARTARHAALERALDALPGGADGAILLGHTLDDQAEGVLLGLARGAGARSLAGMRPVRGRVRRPFLGLGRAVTVGVCAEQGLEPWHDPTNTPAPDDDAAPRRSALRARVLPLLTDVLGPGVVPALARTAEQLREDDDALASYAARLLADAAVVTFVADGSERAATGTSGVPAAASLDCAALAAAPVAVRRRALRAWAVAVGASDGALARTHVLALDALVVAWRGQGPVPLPGRVTVRRRCGTLEGHRPAP